MASIVSDRPVRTPQKPVRSVSVAILPDSDASRIDPNVTDKAAFLALVDEARIRAGLKKEVMALNAGVPFSQFCEALNGTRGNFAIHWLDRQGIEFWMAFHKITGDRYGLSEDTAHDVYAEQIGQLVTLILKHRGIA